MYSGVSGLKAHQTRMDVIGNNIANVNTNGFKKSRVVFADTLYQNMRYGTAPADNRGGTNPMGVGLGSQVASVDQIHTSSPTTTTNKPTDMAISGNGYFIVNNGGEAFYTRSGAFDWDDTYNLVNSNGYFVQGWMANTDPAQATADGDFQINTSGDTVPINLSALKQIAARATTKADFSGNLDATFDIPQTTVAGVTADITPAVAAGYLTSAAGAATDFGAATAGSEIGAAVAGNDDISGLTLPDFNIAIDGGAAQNVVMNPAGLTSGAAIANAMQTGIQALGGAYAAVTVSYVADHYVITSGTTGPSSAVAITAGTSNDCTAVLGIGAANGATDTPGVSAMTGPNFNIQVDGDATAHNIALSTASATGAAIAADMETQIRALGGAYANVTVDYTGGKYVITSGTTGARSQITITSGTVDATHDDAAVALGLTVASGAVATNGTAQFPAETDDVKITQTEVYDSTGRKTTVYLRFFKTSASGGTGTDTTNWACDMSLNPQFDRASGFNAATDFAVAPVDLSTSTQAAPAAVTLGGEGTTANQIVRVYNLQFDKNGVIAGQNPSQQPWLAQVRLTVDRNTGASTGTGYERGAANAGTIISANTGHNFNIQVDGDATAHLITLADNATGADIAADMQTKIQSLGGAYAAVTVAYDAATSRYTVTSGTSSSNSQVRITAGNTDDCTAILGLGSYGAVDVDGGTLPVQDTQEADAANIVATLDFTKLTQYDGNSDVRCDSQDGYGKGNMVKYSVGTDGTITGVYDNGQTKSLARVAVAIFDNPSGLQQVGGTMWQTSVNSGNPIVGQPGNDGRGTIIASALEMSNVDLSEEFTDMIVTQRGFQANSRVITTSDEMLQELVNLKR